MIKKLLYTVSGLLAAGQLVLIVLKLAGVIGDARWLWVLSPLWAFLSVLALFCIYIAMKSRMSQGSGQSDGGEDGGAGNV